MEKKFEYGLDMTVNQEELTFQFGEHVFGPETEIRYLDDIRSSLSEPQSKGPSRLYGIVMDVGHDVDKKQMLQDNLLFGVVTYAQGKIGKEPIRSQGHIHAISLSCGYSTPEVYEIWAGEAYIYMQETAYDNPGKCYAVHAKVGDVVIVPPKWAHATISTNPEEALTFGAWCVRDFGFEYDDVRAHQGLAWFPKVEDRKIIWEANDNYEKSELIVKEPREYTEFQIDAGIPIYQQYIACPEKFHFVSNPLLVEDKWEGFTP